MIIEDLLFIKKKIQLIIYIYNFFKVLIKYINKVRKYDFELMQKNTICMQHYLILHLFSSRRDEEKDKCCIEILTYLIYLLYDGIV